MPTSAEKQAASAQSYWSHKRGEVEARRKNHGGLYHKPALDELQSIFGRWVQAGQSSERKHAFLNLSDIPLQRVYTPLDVPGLNYTRDLGLPGEYPYTRGIHNTMYRGRLWTMRMFSGFGTPEDTNERLKYLLTHGETGLSIAFDMPTLYGYDADDPRAQGEVGRCGVSVSSLQDMEIILDGIPVDGVSTSMTINAPAAVLTCMYVAVGQKQGVAESDLRGTVQADILKEYIAQKEWTYPPEAHLRIIRDLMVHCTQRMPQWNYISISGYHIREAGANAVQELAFTLADGFAYVDLGVEAGLTADEFAPRLSFFFNCSTDFFEEIAKFRAARRIWATVLKEKYGVKNPRAQLLRFHTQTSGASLTWQQPLNNIVRTTVEALAAVLGGTQSLHTNSYDEAWALPTEEAVRVALRTQQIIAEETGVADVVDPLGGSYYVEWLTDEMEQRTYQYLDKIHSLGGVLPAIKEGFFQREIAQTAYKYKLKVDRGERIEVGVNKYVDEEQPPIQTLKIDEDARHRQVERLRRLREKRDKSLVDEALQKLRTVFQNPNVNCIPPMLEAVKTYATLGEITQVGREVFGEWREPSIL